jgi:hypothetical protein
VNAGALRRILVNMINQEAEGAESVVSTCSTNGLPDLFDFMECSILSQIKTDRKKELLRLQHWFKILTSPDVED